MQHDQLICLENGPLPEAEGAGGIGHPFTQGLDRKQNPIIDYTLIVCIECLITVLHCMYLQISKRLTRFLSIFF